jgi:hypothetical protein
MSVGKPKGRSDPAGARLERWLARSIQQGALRDLPPYYSLRERVDLPPEPYARQLLAGLKRAGVEDDGRVLERTRDDGRAFRSWAEAWPAVAQRLGLGRCSAG